MPKRTWLLLVFVGLFFSPALLAQPNPPDLYIVYVDAGDVFMWRAGAGVVWQAAVGDIRAAFPAPDGSGIAYIRPSADPTAHGESLWLARPDGITEHAQLLTLPSGERFGQVAWGDSAALYFNTLQPGLFGDVPQDDLHWIDLPARAHAVLLPAGEGGAFTFSQDRRRMLVTTPGVFGAAAGRLRLIDRAAQAGSHAVRDVLLFAAVASGTHTAFYPAVDALETGAFRVAIPPPEALYDDASSSAPPMALWEITPGGAAVQLGQVQASLFGLPRWSADGAWMAFMRREDRANQFGLFIAAGDGTAVERVLLAEAGDLLAPTWLPAMPLLVYGHDAAYWRSALGQPPQRWRSVAGPLVAPLLVGEWLIYAERSADAWQVWAVSPSTAAPLPVATLDALTDITAFLMTN